MAKILLNTSRIGVVYSINDEIINKFIVDLGDKYSKKDINSTISENILNRSKITTYDVKEKLSENISLEKVFSIQLFKKLNSESYYINQLLFVFSSEELELDSIKNDCNKYLNIFLRNLPSSDSENSWSQILTNKIIKGTYTYEKNIDDDNLKTTNILDIPSGSVFDKNNRFENNSSKYYFAKTNIYEKALGKIDSQFYMRILSFPIALGYKEFFDTQIKKIAYESIVLGGKMNAEEIKDKYEILLDYANEINIFETSYYYNNPINIDSFQAYTSYQLLQNGLKIDEIYKEFKGNLDSLLNTISILEARIRKEEREHREELERKAEEKERKEKEHREELERKAEEKEKKFTSLVGIITGIIAILTFFADGPAILKNAFDYDSTPYFTWLIFIALGVFASGIYAMFNNLLFWKKKTK